MNDGRKSRDATEVRLDIAQNRRNRKWSNRELAGRLLWDIAHPLLFRLSPRICWRWRTMILRLFGARIGTNVHVYSSVKIAIPWNLSIGSNSAVGDGAVIYSLGKIEIGADTTISQFAHLCAGTHDHLLPEFPLVKSPISIGDGCWVCADAFVGPGVIIGDFAIVAARAVVIKDLESFAIAAGNPAKIVGCRKHAG